VTAHQDALLATEPAPVRAAVGELVVVVHGQPHGQGSKKMVPGGRFISDNDKRLRPWRQAVHTAAVDALGDVSLPVFVRDEPVEVEVTFTFARPASHYGTGRNSGVLKASAPRHYTGTPDVDKALRAAYDSIVSAGTMHDDRQIVRTIGAKTYPGGHPDALDVPGAVIRVRAVPR
jgi:Holliday junction resolvase RusA-like endonuclease